jgi:protein SCO1/2
MKGNLFEMNERSFAHRRKGAQEVRKESFRGRDERKLFFPLCLLLIISFAACQPSAKQQSQTSQAKHYDLSGKVVSVDKAKKEVTIAHEEIAGYMPAMTMPFPLKDEWAFDVLAPGNKVGAKLVVDTNSYWLESIVISAGANDTISPPEERKEASVGQTAPDFKLVNQDGKNISFNQYRGKALLLTFIYTRCPIPEYCTLMSTNFNEINKTLQQNPALQARTHLLSITIDPAYDTPKVMRSYGASHTGNYGQEKFERWEFVTGKPDEIKRVAEFFGLSYFEEKDQITHSLRTAIIAPDGKVYKVYPDNQWKPSELIKDVQTLLGAGGG